MASKTKSKTSAAEDAVRRYLMALTDPESLLDRDAIGEAEQRLAKASDPLEQVQALSDLKRLQEPRLNGVEEAFTEHAKDWSESAGVLPEALLEMGVPPKVMRRAGFKVRASGGTTTRRSTTPGKRSTRSKGHAHDKAILDAWPAGETVTTVNLREATGLEPHQVRAALKRLIADGKVVEAGLDPDWNRVGRQPTLYARS